MGKKMIQRRWLAGFMTILLIVGMLLESALCIKMAEAAKKPQLNKKTLSVVVGKKVKLIVKNKEKGSVVSWKTSNKSTVRVTSDGRVKGIKKGSAKITCTVKANKKYKLSCHIQVIEGAKSVVIKNRSGKKINTITLYEGEKSYVKATILPKSSNDTVTWNSSRKKIAAVNKRGNITAKSAGKTNITATALSGKKAIVTVTVKEKIPVIHSFLKDAYSEYFSIGAAVNNSQLQNAADLAHIKSHYNSITLENEMKPDYLFVLNNREPVLVDKSQAAYPVPESYQEQQVPKLKFDIIDQTLEIAKNNGLKMRGHTLVWHSQTPAFFFREGYSRTGSLVSKEVMNARMEYYIQQVLTHVKTKYPNIIYAWDVVNEAFENDGSSDYHKGLRGNSSVSNWYSIYKDDSYIMNAFTYARKYQEKSASLFYNDYNEYIPNKTDNIITLVSKLKDLDLIDGIGMQGHLDLDYPSVSLIKQAIEKFGNLGLQIQLTELDLTVSSTSQFREQAAMYEELFTMLIQMKRKGINITNVTFWGLSDQVSWRKSQHPLIFEENYVPKLAISRILSAVGKK